MFPNQSDPLGDQHLRAHVNDRLVYTDAPQGGMRSVPLRQATGALRDLLIELAETHEQSAKRPACDADTTLQDWLDAGF